MFDRIQQLYPCVPQTDKGQVYGTDMEGSTSYYTINSTATTKLMSPTSHGNMHTYLTLHINGFGGT